MNLYRGSQYIPRTRSFCNPAAITLASSFEIKRYSNWRLQRGSTWRTFHAGTQRNRSGLAGVSRKIKHLVEVLAKAHAKPTRFRLVFRVFRLGFAISTSEIINHVIKRCACTQFPFALNSPGSSALLSFLRYRARLIGSEKEIGNVPGPFFFRISRPRDPSLRVNNLRDQTPRHGQPSPRK